MFIELQVSTESILPVLRGQLRLHAMCIPHEYSHDGKVYVIDHIEISEDTTITKAPGGVGDTVVQIQQTVGGQTQQTPVIISPANKVRIVQPVKIVVVTLEALEAKNTKPSKGSVEVINLLFEMNVSKKTSSAVAFGVFYEDVELSPALAALPEADTIINTINSAAAKLSPGWTNLDLDALEDMLDFDISVSNVGAGISADESFVAIRLQLFAASDIHIQGWTDFFQSNIPDHRGGADWAMVMNHDLLTNAISAQFKENLEVAKREGQFLPSPAVPSATWHPSPPHVNVQFWGDVPEVCPLLILGIPFGWIDVGVDVSADLIFSVPEEGGLQVNAKFNWETEDLPVGGCAIGLAAFYPMATTLLLAEDKLGALEFFIGLTVSPIGVFIGIPILASEKDPELPDAIVGEFTEVEETDADAEFMRQFTDISLPHGLTLTGVTGASRGLVMRGNTAIIPEVLHPPELLVEPEDPEFAWGFKNPCSTDITFAATMLITFSNKIQQGLLPYTPLMFCGAAILEDELNQYVSHLSVGFNKYTERGSIEISIPIQGLLSKFKENPYPCKVLLKTNGGARLITIEPPPIMTQSQIEFLLEVVLPLEKLKCIRWTHILWSKIYNPLWDIDPPDWALQLEQFWMVNVADTVPEARLSVQTQAGEILAQAEADRSGKTWAAMSVTGLTQEAGLNLLLEPPTVFEMKQASNQPGLGATASGETSRTYGGLAVHQSLLIQDRAITLRRAVKSLSAGRFLGEPAFSVVTEEGLLVLDAGHPRVLRPILKIAGAGWTGAVSWARGILLYGPRGGRVYLSRGDEPATEQVELLAEPVQSAVAYGDGLYVQTRSALLTFGGDLQQTADFEAQGQQLLVYNRDQLIVGERDRLLKLDLAKPSTPQLSNTYDIRGLTSLGDAQLLTGKRSEIYIDSELFRNSVVRLEEDGTITEMANYINAPWFFHAVKVGSILGRVMPDGHTVAVYIASPPVTLTEAQLEGRETPQEG